MGRARGFNLRYEIVDSCAKRRGEEEKDMLQTSPSKQHATE